jgi:hypothetical protein
MHCDHCRKKLGLIVHRDWDMRFCSAVCMKTYQHRLGGGTKPKYTKLNFETRNIRRKLGVRLLDSVMRQFAG